MSMLRFERLQIEYEQRLISHHSRLSPKHTVLHRSANLIDTDSEASLQDPSLIVVRLLPLPIHLLREAQLLVFQLSRKSSLYLIMQIASATHLALYSAPCACPAVR